MPQAVPDLSSISGASARSSGSAARSRTGDKTSFRDALGDASATDSKPALATESDDEPETPVAKKPVATEKAADKKVAKATPSQGNDKSKVDPEKSANEKQGSADEAPDDQQHQPEPKLKKHAAKDLVEVKSVATDAPALPPAAMVQFQEQPRTSGADGSGKTIARNASDPAKSAATRAKEAGVTSKNPAKAPSDADGGSAPATTDASVSKTATQPSDQSDDAVPAKPHPSTQSKQPAESATDPADSSAATASGISAAPAGQGVPLDSDAVATDPLTENSAAPVSRASARPGEDALLNALTPSDTSQSRGPASAGQPVSDASKLPPPPAEAQFAQANHPQIVAGIAGRLLPNGGSMHLRLDPPELGAINVHVEMRDGVMNASFESDSDQTVQLLSHSLGGLKTALEAQGMNVEKLHVHQSPKQQSSSNQEKRSESDHGQEHAAQQERQRKEVMRRMWRKLMKGQDPLDMVA